MHSLMSLFVMLAWSIKGAGDSVRCPAVVAPLLEPEGESEAPQISHSRRDGWLRKVHLGHGDGMARARGARLCDSVVISSACSL
jgi:hypothetical protein